MANDPAKWLTPMRSIVLPHILLAVWGALALPSIAQEVAEDEVNALHDKFWELLPVGNLTEAERVARQSIEVGRREWKQDPTLITYGYLDLADLLMAREKYVEAEQLLKQAVDILKKQNGAEDAQYGWALGKLADCAHQRARYTEAETLTRESLRILEKAVDPLDSDVTTVRLQLASVQAMLRKFDAAEATLRETLDKHQKANGASHESVAPLHMALAEFLLLRYRFADCQRECEAAIKIYSAAREENAGDIASANLILARAWMYQGKFAEAEDLATESLRTAEGLIGENALPLNDPLIFLSTCQTDRGRFAEAEASARRALKIAEQVVGPEHTLVAQSLNALASIYVQQYRLVEAQSLCRRSIAMLEKMADAPVEDLAESLDLMAQVQGSNGRFAEADELFNRAEKLRQNEGGDNRADLADLILFRAMLLQEQHRYADAQAHFEEVWQQYTDIVGGDYPRMGLLAARLAACCTAQKKYEEAQTWIERAMDLQRRRLGPDHPDVADSLVALAEIRTNQGRYDEATGYYQQAQAIIIKSYGENSSALGDLLVSQVEMLLRQKRLADAEPLADRAIELLERGSRAAGAQAKAYLLRARVGWDQGRQSEAIADLRRALDLAEQQRGASAGAEQERASLFGNFAEAFETMVEWQVKLGDVTEALSAIERSRARSLLDELSRPGIDLQVGRSEQDRERLQTEESELQSKVAGLEAQLRSADIDAQQRVKFEADLAAAREALYDHFRAARATSPVYRTLLASNSGPLRLSQLRSRIVGADGLLLVYLIGKNGGYCISIGPKDARLSALVVDEAAAKQLRVDPGPLSAARLRAILMDATGAGVVQQLADPKAALQATDRLHALWEVLLPEADRRTLLDGSTKRLVVVPDGPLALLPFEALVVSQEGEPKYLLDAGPPVLYGPSASVLHNLRQRALEGEPAEREPVLTIGDPAYGAPPAAAAARGATKVKQPLLATQYRSAGGELSRLPYSGIESQWVSMIFQKASMQSIALRGPQATEARLRTELPGRRIVHLACHGLADQAHGNFFGSLAVAPGPNSASDAADNGFLTLAEIYELDLNACELAILSACQTNYGPEQEGEGVWGLSRGFLVAGARRVVASNWLVDDEAAAHLMSYFCGNVAKTSKTTGPDKDAAQPDYAVAMQLAKREVRKKEKWRSPYYWATFVLVGPN